MDIDDGIEADTDNDGVPNYLDIDSDADGIPDNIEWQPEKDYKEPRFSDTDSDGWDDAYDPDNGGIYRKLVDTDIDGVPDFLDSNSDGDEFYDIEEISLDTELQKVAPLNIDANNDGLDDLFDIIYGMQTAGNFTGSNVSLVDEDNDGIRDWRDGWDGKSIPGDKNSAKTMKVELFPNPTAKIFYIEIPAFNNYEEIKMEIFNPEGKLIYEKNIESSITEINPGTLKQGLYFIKMWSKTKSYTGRLVISN